MSARLIDVHVPTRPEAVAIVVHGGASRGTATPVSPAQLSVLRMVPVAHRLVGVGRGRLVVLRLLNSTRGWDARRSPVDDLRWALGQVAERFGEGVPVALVGHSLGGRAALLAAGEPAVTSVVALAAWLPDGERMPPARGRRVLFVHGDRDRIARIGPARAAARRMASTAEVGVVTVGGGTHSMLGRHRAFDGTAAAWVAATVLGDTVGGPAGAVLAGEAEVEV